MKPYEFFEHTADIGVHVRGVTLPELFVNAARAMYEAMGEMQKAEGRMQKSVELRASSLEDLLHDWLSELLFEVEANHVLFDEMEVEVSAGKLTASLGGARSISDGHTRTRKSRR